MRPLLYVVEVLGHPSRYCCVSTAAPILSEDLLYAFVANIDACVRDCGLESDLHQ